MKAMILKSISQIENKPLILEDVEVPKPSNNQILVRINVCGICRTELDEIEGRLPPKLPIIPGHQIIGRVYEIGSSVKKFKKNDRVGIAWIYHTCGNCKFCKNGLENLCNNFIGTGHGEMVDMQNI